MTVEKRRLLNLKFKVNNVAVSHINLFTDHPTHESSNVYKLANTTKELDKKITVCHNNKEYELMLPSHKFISYKQDLLTAMTLFKGDYKLIPTYIKHYKSLGIMSFNLYYNYSHENLIKLPNMTEILHNIDMDKDITCTFMEWNFPYWKIINRQRMHMSQSPAISDMYYKSKHLYQNILFNDLDEYIYFNDKEINRFDELLIKYKDEAIFQFNGRWSKYIVEDKMEQNVHNQRGISYLNFTNTFNMNNFVVSGWPDARRSKILLKTNLLGMKIHKALSQLSSNDDILKIPYEHKVVGEFHHVHNILGKYRHK